jgi:DNA-binding NtrC family response regulator
MNIHILVVDDEASMREVLHLILSNAGYNVSEACDGAEALQLLERQRFDVLLADVNMPRMDGIQLLLNVRGSWPGLKVIVMTGFGSIPDAVRAIQLGAFQYLSKPFEPADLLEHVQRACARITLARQASRTIILGDEKMKRIDDLISRAALVRWPVLILGESGTGKELVAREIHRRSPGNNLAFVPVDCGALPASLIEDELFGHVDGAFTGATKARKGLLQAAGCGTAFFDEIGELALEQQTRLLRTIQEKVIRPIGGNEPITFNARIIAATNKDLDQEVSTKRFRADLYYRLKVICVHLPPLRERKDEIPMLTNYFLRVHGTGQQRIKGIAPDAMRCLLDYDWPGNVRELENCIMQALALGNAPEITPADVLRADPEHHSDSRATLEELERKAIERALVLCQGNKQRAAKVLGIGKTTLYRKVAKFGI